MIKDNSNIVTAENTILAGTMVRDKSGGPKLLIVGFSLHPNEVEEGKLKYQSYLDQKIFINKDRKTLEELNKNLVGDENVYNYFYFLDVIQELTIADFKPKCSDLLYIVCKFWSDKNEDFVYVNKYLTELELVE